MGNHTEGGVRVDATVRRALEKLETIVAYPPKGHKRRSKDGYPTEVVYDDFAYKRMVNTYREAVQEVVKELKMLVA